MMDLNIAGGTMRINDDGSTAATPKIIKDIMEHYEASDDKDRKKPEILEFKD